MKVLASFFIASFFFTTIHIYSQELTKEDYARAVSFMNDNYNNKTVFNLFTDVHWFENKEGLWFVDYSKHGKMFKTVSLKNYKINSLFDHQKMARSLSSVLNDTINAADIPFETIEEEDDHLIGFIKGKQYILDIKNNTITPVSKKEKIDKNEFESKSPNGKWIAFARDYNLFIKSTQTNEEHQLSFDGKKNFEYATWYGWYDTIEGENGILPKHFGVNWSEDSKWISTSVCDLRNASKMYLLDWSIDSLYRPKLLSYYRGSPGDTNMVRMKPVFFNVETKKEVKSSLPNNTHINAVSTRWGKKSGTVFADYLERGFQKGFVLKLDLNKNETTALIKESSNTNIDNFEYWLLEEKNKIIFLSERSGWRQLYEVDLKTNKTTPITKGNYYINDIEYIDKDNGIVYFTASGKEKNRNPYHQQLFKTTLQGEITLLTPENANHIISFSKDGKYFTDNYSTIQVPTKTVLRDTSTGKVLTLLTEADVSQKKEIGWKTPEVFQLTAKDNKTIIYGALWKPTNFNPQKKYPIIDHTYTGPHTQMFPKSFNKCFMNQSLAELGFVVMMVDGLGSSGRSKYFHDSSYKKMGDNLKDHILAIKYLGKKFDWIDIERVGIFGHSAGGFDTGRALLAYPDIYKVGVASSADHDFRMEKAWWPEMYMGWPIDESYEKTSNITNAHNLRGKLLITHGGIDENVNPSATFKLAEALIKADKDFDLLILPSQHHGYHGVHRKYFIKKRWNYFVEHLLETNPIWEFSW